MSDFSKESLGGDGQLLRYLNEVNFQVMALLNQDDLGSVSARAQKYNQCEDGAECQVAAQKCDQALPVDTITHGKLSLPPQICQLPTQQVEWPSSHHLRTEYFQHQNNQYQNETTLYYQQQQQHPLVLVDQTPQDQVPLAECAYCAWLARISQQQPHHQIQAITFSEC